MDPEEGRVHTEGAHSHPHREQMAFHRALLLPQIDLMKEDGTISVGTETNSITKDKEIVQARDTQLVITTPMYRVMVIPRIVREMGVSIVAIGVIIAGSRHGGEVGVPIFGTRVDE